MLPGRIAEELTAEIVREFLDYDESTGVMTWRARDKKWFGDSHAANVWNARHAGVEAGNIAKRRSGQRRVIGIFGKSHYTARLAHLHVTGYWPRELIDHEDGDTLNNCWENLRPASRAQNGQNRGPQRNNATGYKGVSYLIARDKFRALINANGRQISLGYFTTPEAASSAYQRAARKYFGKFCPQIKESTNADAS
jgi:hypothetical protein